MMESDGDFDAQVSTSKEAIAQAALFKSLGDSVIGHFIVELGQTYGTNAQAAIDGLEQTRVYKGQVWTGIGIDGTDGPWLWIAIRNLFGPGAASEHRLLPVPGLASPAAA